MSLAYIGLGANLGDRAVTLAAAISRLGILGEVLAVSSLYETAPVGYLDQPPFLNAVAAVETSLTPAQMVQWLLAIEQTFGRKRTFRNAPRTLDLDLLLLGDAIQDTDAVKVPHPRLVERAFVLVPLAEIAPQLRHPVLGESMRDLLSSLPDQAGISQVAAPGWHVTPSGSAGMPPGR